ncbi:unnamed protein product [Spirodela intermedia]|uniref:Retrotransposon gag domain-containing protein n=1 Tax=Spirodela intermedia TaxID=51605 RepID=A0A7I8KQM4_SPIIN|nr:unnamed protein product [Spirodela intermedia]
MRKYIWSFSQRPGETLHETWEKFKDLLRKCPHHAIPKWQLNRIFYDGLLEQQRNIVDSICGGAFIEKTPDEIYSLYENLSESSRDQASFELYDRDKKRGIYELHHDDDSKLRNEVNQINQRLEIIDLLIDNIRKPFNPQLNSNNPNNIQNPEVRRPNSNSEFRPKPENKFQKNQSSQIQPDAMKMMQQMSQMMQQTMNQMMLHQKQTIEALGNKREEGQLPSQPIKNSGNRPTIGFQQGESKKENVDKPKQNQIGVEEDFIDSTKEISKERTTIPFPKALEPRQRKKKEHNEEIKKILQDVQISLPLLTAIEHIPEYARVLKEMCTPKRAPRVEKLSMHASALLLNQLPYKLRDTGNTLLDTSASINLLSVSICDKFNISDLKPSTVTLQFADRSIKHPKGILENVIVTVKGCKFPADFVVLEMDFN